MKIAGYRNSIIRMKAILQNSLDIEGEEAKDNRVWFEKKVTKKFQVFSFKFSAGLLLRSQKEQAFVLYFIRQMD